MGLGPSDISSTVKDWLNTTLGIYLRECTLQIVRQCVSRAKWESTNMIHTENRTSVQDQRSGPKSGPILGPKWFLFLARLLVGFLGYRPTAYGHINTASQDHEANRSFSLFHSRYHEVLSLRKVITVLTILSSVSRFDNKSFISYSVTFILCVVYYYCTFDMMLKNNLLSCWSCSMWTMEDFFI